MKLVLKFCFQKGKSQAVKTNNVVIKPDHSIAMTKIRFSGLTSRTNKIIIKKFKISIFFLHLSKNLQDAQNIFLLILNDLSINVPGKNLVLN